MDVDCIHLHLEALLVFKRKLKLGCGHRLALFGSHTQINLKTPPGDNVVVFGAERMVLILGIQGLDNEVDLFAISGNSGFFETYFLGTSGWTQTAKIV